MFFPACRKQRYLSIFFLTIVQGLPHVAIGP
jgi:hypothetical protein